MANTNKFVSSNRLCPCGEDHSPHVISLEIGVHITTAPFSIHGSLNIDFISKKKKTTSSDLVNLFWSEEQELTESIF